MSLLSKLSLLRGKAPNHFSSASRNSGQPNNAGHLQHVFGDPDFHRAETITVRGFDGQKAAISRRVGIFGKVRKAEEIQSDIVEALGEGGEWAHIIFARPAYDGGPHMAFKDFSVRNPMAEPIETLDL